MEMFGCKMLTAPSELPVSLAQLRLHVKQDDTYEDDILSAYAYAATKYVQDATGKQLITATFRLWLDRFPDGGFNPRRRSASDWTYLDSTGSFGNMAENGTIEIPISPFVAVTEFVYTDTSGVEQTVSASTYTTDTVSEPGRIVLAYGQSWPIPQIMPAAVRIKFTAGFGTADDVPETMKQAIRLLVGHWYIHRVAVSDVQTFGVPLAVESLLGLESVRAYR